MLVGLLPGIRFRVANLWRHAMDSLCGSALQEWRCLLYHIKDRCWSECQTSKHNKPKCIMSNAVVLNSQPYGLLTFDCSLPTCLYVVFIDVHNTLCILLYRMICIHVSYYIHLLWLYNNVSNATAYSPMTPQVYMRMQYTCMLKICGHTYKHALNFVSCCSYIAY